jgi:lysophospholipase
MSRMRSWMQCSIASLMCCQGAGLVNGMSARSMMLASTALVEAISPSLGWSECLDRCTAEGCDNCRIMTGHILHPKGPVRGTILFLPGRSGILGNREEILKAFYERGFDVYTLDWRGQGESSRILEDSHKVHIDSFDSYLEDICALKLRARLEKAPKPWILVGSSMGGHMALRTLEEAPEGISGAILVVPMIDVWTDPVPRSFAPYLAKTLKAFGLSTSYAPSHGPYDIETDRFEGNRSTRNPAGFVAAKKYMRANPAYVTGGVTVGWASAVFDSIAKANNPERLQKIQVPILMINAGDDQVVNAEAAAAVADLLPNCREITLPGARHGIWSELDETVNELWGEIDRYLNLYFRNASADKQAPAMDKKTG